MSDDGDDHDDPNSDDGDDDPDEHGENDPADNGGRSPYRWWRRLVDRLLACVGMVGHGMERLLQRVHIAMFR